MLTIAVIFSGAIIFGAGCIVGAAIALAGQKSNGGVQNKENR